MARVVLILTLSIFLAPAVLAGQERNALGNVASLKGKQTDDAKLQPGRIKLVAGKSTAQLALEAEKLRIANDSNRALLAFQELVKREPKNARYRAGLGNVYCQLNRLPEAKQELELALNLNPRNVEVHKFLALYHIRRQDMKSARLEYKKLLALDPRHNCKCGGIQRLLGLEEEKSKPLKKAAR